MVNREIKSRLVDVVNEYGKGLDRMELENAIALAEQTGQDVVCVNSKSEIPVVKIMDYNKYVYEKQKKEKENRKKSRLNSQTIKEIQISDVIAEHDMGIKAKNIDRLLKEGSKVRLVIRYKGRSIRMINMGPSKLQSLANMISTKYIVESTPKIEGNKVTMVVAPSKK